jgi:hypothetical protein
LEILSIPNILNKLNILYELDIAITMSANRKANVFGETSAERQRRYQEQADAQLARQIDLEEEEAARERGNQRVLEVESACSWAEEKKRRQQHFERRDRERRRKEIEETKKREIREERERERAHLEAESNRRKQTERLRHENSLRAIEEQARVQAEKFRVDEARKAAERERRCQERWKRKSEESLATADKDRSLEVERNRSQEKALGVKLGQHRETTKSLTAEEIELQKEELLTRLRATLKSSNTQPVLVLRPPQTPASSKEERSKHDPQTLDNPASPSEVVGEAYAPPPRHSESANNEQGENMLEFMLRIRALGVDLGGLGPGGVEAAYKKSQRERRDAPPPDITLQTELSASKRYS